MIQALRYGGYESVILTLEVILATEEDSDIGYFVDVDSGKTDATTTKTKFPICPDPKKVDKEFLTDFTKNIITQKYKPVKN